MAYSEQLERDTQSCRDQLADTLDELRARMTPGEVVDQLVDYAKDTTGGLFSCANLRRFQAHFGCCTYNRWRLREKTAR